MQTQNTALMQETFDLNQDPWAIQTSLMEDEEKWEEEWIVKINTGAEYTLGKEQAWVIQEAISSGNRGVVMFKTFSVSIPYIAEFYRTRRYLKAENSLIYLPERAKEKAWTEEDHARARQRIKEMKEKLLNKKN